jgi:hypothetical protein
MSRLIKILHIDPDYKATYFIYRPGSSIRTPVSLQTAIELLKKVDFDLILSEPHNKAILKKEKPVIKTKPIKVDGLAQRSAPPKAGLSPGLGYGWNHLNSIQTAREGGPSPAEQKVVF